MIQVSNAFKENIKKTVRELGGFVELIVSGGYYLADGNEGRAFYVTSSTQADICNLNTIADDKAIMYKYASLEDNRTLLDGSFILANEDYTNKNTGFVGGNIFGTGSFEISVDMNKLSGAMLLQKKNKQITLYFEEGYATSFDVEIDAFYSDFNARTHYYTITNDKSTITIDASDIPDLITENNNTYNFLCFTRINISVNNWSIQNRRARIKQINIGETMLFQNRDLIELNIDEEISLDNVDLPSNTCNVMLNNYDRKFNLLNKYSVLNRLKKTSVIRPFIGVSLGGGIDYVDMGSYSYTSYTENQDKTITLYGSGAVESYASKNNVLWQKGLPDANTMTTLSHMGLTNNEVTYNGTVYLENTDTGNMREQLQAMALYCGGYIKENKELNSRLQGKLSMKVIKKQKVDEIPLSLQIKEPKITKKNKTKTIKITSNQIGSLNDEEKTLLDNYTDSPIDGRIVINLSTSSPINVNSIKVYINNTQIQEGTTYHPGYVIYNSYYMPRIEIVNLTNEENIDIKIVGKEYNQTSLENTIENGSIQEGEALEYRNNYATNTYQKERIAKYVFKNERDYEFEINFNGDPSLEVGDTIEFETVDGYMVGIINNIQTKFNGGLQATIKGVCNSVL